MADTSTLFDYFNKNIWDSRAQKMLYFGNIICTDELLSATAKVASFLTDQGCNAGDVVGIALPNMPDAIMACYGISRMGGIANIMHPKLGVFAVEELLISTKTKVIFILNSIYHIHKATLDKLHIKAIICYPSYFMPAAQAVIAAIFEKKVKAELTFKDVLHCESTFIDREFSGEAPAVYIHSGGTSGEAKTVVLNSTAINSVADNIMQWVHGDQKEPAHNGCMLMALPIFHCFGLAVTMHTGISHSSTLLIPQFRAHQVVRSIKKHRLTHLMGVPQMYKKMIDTNKFNGKKLAQIGYVFCGGDALSADLRTTFNNIMASSGSHAVMSEGYGLSETASVFTIERLGDTPSQGAPIGRNNLIVINESGDICSPFEVGELYLNSASAMLGYLTENGISRQSFVNINGSDYLKSGDCGYLDQKGNLYFADRKKRSIKISAHNIFPAEVERIAKGLPMIADCVVARTTINGKPATRMFVVLNKSYSLSSAVNAVKRVVTANISKYAVPRDYVEVKQLARTKLSKVDYKFYEK